MSQSLRKDDSLSTADLAGRTAKREDNESLTAETPARMNDDPRLDGPRLVDNAPVNERTGITEDVSRNDRVTNEWIGQDRFNQGRVDQGRVDQEPLNAQAPPRTETGSWSSKPVGERDGSLNAPLLSEIEVNELRTRWSGIQAEFVDEPRRSVEQADQLVATAMQRLAEGFANERASLEKQWDSGDNVSTEELRIALQRYRAFFGRLLNAA